MVTDFDFLYSNLESLFRPEQPDFIFHCSRGEQVMLRYLEGFLAVA